MTTSPAVSKTLSHRLASIRPLHLLLALQLAAWLVAIADIVLASRSSTVPTPHASLHAALVAAGGLYGIPALCFGAVLAWIYHALRALYGEQFVAHAFTALRKPARDGVVATLLLTAMCILVLDAVLLYGYLRALGFEMQNRRNGALSSSLVAVALLPLLSLLGFPLYRLLRPLIEILPSPRTGVLLALGASALLGIAVLAVLSVDWRILHFGPWKALAAVGCVAGVLLAVLPRLRNQTLAVAVSSLLFAAAAGALYTTIQQFGSDARALALVSEESAGASFLFRQLRARFDRDGDGYASRLGGADCNDADPEIYPGAQEQPGNATDEDCDGLAAPAPPVASAPPPVAPAVAATPPRGTGHFAGNWLVITIDTLRADRIVPKTAPNLSALAARSAHFTQVYAQAPNTPRSFPSFLTSRLPSEVHFVKQSLNFSPLTGKDPTLFSALAQSGVRPYGVFSHFYLDPKTNLGTGFVEWNNAGAKTLSESNSDIAAPRITQAVVAKLAQLAQAHKTGAPPFALWTHLFEPHSTYMDHPEHPVPKGWKFAEQRYDAEVTFVDGYVGKILDTLREQGLADNTAIVVFSDHGEAFGEHKLAGQPLYFHGEALYNEVLHVPLMIYVPGQPPQRITERATLMDMAPTVLSLAGVPVPPTFRGRSLAPFVLGQPRPADLPSPPVVAELLPCTAWQKNERVVLDHLEGADYAVYAKYTDNLRELYNLSDDPTQQKNLVHSEPARATELLRRLATYTQSKY